MTGLLCPSLDLSFRTPARRWQRVRAFTGAGGLGTLSTSKTKPFRRMSSLFSPQPETPYYV